MGVPDHMFLSMVSLRDGTAYKGTDAIMACNAQGSYSDVAGACLCQDDCASAAAAAEFRDAKRTAINNAAYQGLGNWYKTRDGIARWKFENVPSGVCNIAKDQVSNLEAFLLGAFTDIESASLVAQDIDCSTGVVEVAIKFEGFCGFVGTPAACNQDPPAHDIYSDEFDYGDVPSSETGEGIRRAYSRLFGQSFGQSRQFSCYGINNMDLEVILQNRDISTRFAESINQRLDGYRFTSLGSAQLESSIRSESPGVLSLVASYDGLNVPDGSARDTSDRAFVCSALGFFKLNKGDEIAGETCKYTNTGVDMACVASQVQTAVASGGMSRGVAIFNKIFDITSPANNEAVEFMRSLSIDAPEQSAPAASSSSDSSTSAALYAVAGFAAVVIVVGTVMLFKTGRCSKQNGGQGYNNPIYSS